MLAGLRAPDRGVLFVITGPSGVGKSTLIKAARAQIPGLGFSVSATTRSARPGERQGADYYFLSEQAFEEKVQQGEFLEYAQVYDHRYGTLRAPVMSALEQGRSVLLDIDLLGARQVRQSMPEAVHVAILPPDLPSLEHRLRARNTESDEVIDRRMRQVAFQLSGVAEFDYLVVNDVLESAHHVFQGVMLAELSRRARLQSLVAEVQQQTRD